MAEARLTAENRTEFGKGGARRTRRAGLIPAVLYGHGAEPRHISLPAHAFAAAIRRGGSNVLLTLDIDGDEQLALPKAIQRHPIRDVYEHVDLIAVRRGEKIVVSVPLEITGDVAPGGLLSVEFTSVSVEAEATHLPSSLQASVEGLEIGSHITAGDLELPSGAALAGDPEQILLVVQEAPTAEAMEGETAEAASEQAAPAEAGDGAGGSED